MIRPIRTDDDLVAALARIDLLFEAVPGTDLADELEVLVILVEDYERKRFPIIAPTPLAAIKFRMEQQGLRQKDLLPYLGTRARVSEVLSGKRKLSKAMIRRISLGLGIPLEALLPQRDIIAI